MMQEQLYLYSFILIVAGVLVYILYLIKRYFSIGRGTSPLAVSKNVENGYIQLLNLLYNNTNKKEVESEIRNISIYKLDGRYMGGYTKQTDEFDALSFRLDYFYDLLTFLEARKEVLILDLNQRSTLKEFRSKIKLALGDLIKNIPLFYENDLSENKLLINKDELLMYQKKLSKFNIQMAFIDDGSDSYNIVLHRPNKEKDLKKAIFKIGFEYKKNLI